jgi:hypothetical protein
MNGVFTRDGGNRSAIFGKLGTKLQCWARQDGVSVCRLCDLTVT